MFDSMDKGFDRTMQKAGLRIVVASLGMIAIVLGFGLAIVGGIVYVAWHLIQNF